MKLGRRSLLLAGAAFPASAYAQCVTDKFVVDACMGGVRLTAPPGVTFDQSFLGGSLGPGAVFTRASTGTYSDSAGVLRSAATDAPRFDYDPVTLQMKGLLLEDTSTNLWLQSADASNAAWSKGNVTVAAPVVTANQTAAPDGTVTAASAAYPAVSAAGNYSTLFQSITVTAQQYAWSVWLKGTAGGEQLYVAVLGAVAARSRVTLTTQWQRFTLITPTATAGSGFFEIGCDLRDGSQTAIAAQTIYVWGAQVEALPYASSYIPTTTVSVTRARDALSYPVASVTGFDTTKGSLAHEYYVEGCVPNFTAPIQLVGASVNNDFISVDQLTTAGATGSTPVVSGVLIKAAAVTQGSANFTGGIATPGGVVHRGAAAWALSGTVICAHDGAGQSTITGTNTSLPVIANLTIAGQMNAQGNVVSQWARRTRYWPRALSQAELISVTT